MFSAHLPKVRNHPKSSVSQRTFRPLTSSEGVGRGVPRHSPGVFRVASGGVWCAGAEAGTETDAGTETETKTGTETETETETGMGTGTEMETETGTGSWISPESYWFFLSMP